MALKVGDLYVLLSARTSAFGKAMQSAAKVTEQVANKIKKSAREIGQVGALMAGAVGAAMAVAAQHNRAVAVEVGRAKAVFATFATELASMMLPALQSLSEHLRSVLGWWQRLSPETKESIGHWVGIATSVGLAAMALGKVSGLVSALMPVFGALGSVIGLGLAPLLGIAFVVTALIAGVAVLHRAWRENWGGIQQIVKDALEKMSSYWTKFKDFLTGIWGGIIDEAAAAVKGVVAMWLRAQVALGRMTENDAGVVQRGTFAGINTVASTLKQPSAVKNLALEAVAQVKKGAELVTDEWALMLKGLKEKVQEIFGGPGGSVVDTGKKRGGALEAYSAATEFAIAHSLDKAQRISSTSGPVRGTTEAKAASSEFWQGMEKMPAILAKIVGPLKVFGQKLKVALVDSLSDISGALKVGGNMLVSKLGELGQVIQSGIQGFQNGGIWGALIAVILEMLSRFQRWGEIMDIANGQLATALEDMKPGLSAIVDGLKQAMGGIGIIARSIHGILNPIMKLIGHILERLAPIFALIGLVLQPIGMLLEMIMSILDIVFKAMGPMWDLIMLIMKGIGMSILGSMRIIGEIWNFILETLRRLLIDLGLESAALEVSKVAGINTEKLKEQMDHLAEVGLEGLANESAQTAEQLGKLGDTAQDVSEQLTNVPNGYKIAMERFNATAAISISGGFSGTMSREDGRRERFLMTGNPSSANSFNGRK